jgi:hypothetical protein
VEEARRSDAVHREGAVLQGVLHQINKPAFHRQSSAPFVSPESQLLVLAP